MKGGSGHRSLAAAVAVLAGYVRLLQCILALTLATAPAAGGKQQTSMYMGRQIANVFTNREWLLRGGREREEDPNRLVLQLAKMGALAPNATVADLGCGPCFLSWRFAVAVGRAGLVLALDTDSRTVAECADAARQHSIPPGVLQSVTPPAAALMAGEAPGPRQLGLGLQHTGALDSVLLVDTYHELQSPYETVRAALTTLKHGGLLVVVEYKSTALHILPTHRMAEQQLLRELNVFRADALSLRECDHKTLKHQYVCVFERGSADVSATLVARDLSSDL